MNFNKEIRNKAFGVCSVVIDVNLGGGSVSENRRYVFSEKYTAVDETAVADINCINVMGEVY